MSAVPLIGHSRVLTTQIKIVLVLTSYNYSINLGTVVYYFNNFSKT